LWILNAVVIGTVVLAAAAAATTTGHTVVAASDHFLLYYAGVLALIALTAEVGIGLVASDRIFMKPSARVTAQALHRAMGFGAIAFLIIHIALEIIAGRSQPADAVIPFLDKGKTFYLGLGTVASDMFIVIMMTGIYRARLAAKMSPKAWRVIHASAYAAWIFGLVHGLLAGRPAKSFFGFSGFVAWSYGACVVAVAAALMVRLVAKNRAGNELASHPVPDSGGAGGWTAAAAALTSAGAIPGAAALTATAMPAPALSAGSPGALDGARARSRQPGRPQLALPAGASAAQQPGRQTRSAQYGSAQYGSGPYDERAAYLADTRRIGATGPIGSGTTGSFERTGQFGGSGQDPRVSSAPQGQTGPLHRVGPFEQTGPMPPVGHYEGASHQYERTGQIDRSGQYEQPAQDQLRGQLPGDRVSGGPSSYGPSPAGPLQPGPLQPGQFQPGQFQPGQFQPGQFQAAPVQNGYPGQPKMPRPNDQTGPYERPHEDWSGPMQRIGPPAMPPRYAAGNYNDWSGPLERIDPAAPPSRYGAPPSQYGADGQYGGRGQYGRPGAEPRYERTGEIDRSGQYERPDYDQPQRDQSQYDQSEYEQGRYEQSQYGPRRYEQPRDEQSQYEQSQYGQSQYGQSQYGPPAGQSPFPAPAPQFGGPPRYAPAPYGYEGQPGQPMPHQQDQSGAYDRPHPDPYQPPQYQPGHYPPAHYPPAQHDPGPYQYQPPAGYERGGQPGQFQAPMRHEEPMQYDQYQRGPDGRSGQFGRPNSDPRERAAHYASFAEQDATFTRPRPAGARDQFSPQDETDPLNIVPLNIGNYS
jgi:preprotein translocase subunit SecG